MSTRDDLPVLQPLRRQRSTEQAIASLEPWSRTVPGRDESRRWRCVDGRWVAMCIGADDELGKIVVTDSTGRRELCDDSDEALRLALAWQTW